MGEAELRRSGSMRPSQKLKRSRLERKHGRPVPHATRISVQELLTRSLPEGSHVTLRSDEHQAYPMAIRRLKGREIEHERTSSKEIRTTHNPLFPVNLADLLLRHSSANHKRETIAFSKRRQGALYRAAIWIVWRNYIKSRSENRRNSSPAELMGIIPKRLTVEAILAKRLFPSRIALSRWVRRCYDGKIPTRRLKRIRIHQPKFEE
jgi:hypothetical protein